VQGVPQTSPGVTMKFLSLEHLGIVVAVAGMMFLQQHNMRFIDAMILYGVMLANVRILKLQS
jgi:hypothetical protein